MNPSLNNTKLRNKLCEKLFTNIPMTFHMLSQRVILEFHARGVHIIQSILVTDTSLPERIAKGSSMIGTFP